MPSDHEQFRELALVLPALQLGHYLRQAAQNNAYLQARDQLYATYLHEKENA